MSTAIAVTVFAVAYLFIATERIPKLVAALAGAVLAFGVVGSADASTHATRGSTGTSSSCCSA